MRLVDETKQEVEKLILAGYWIGEQQLEGFSFWITLLNDKLVVKLSPDDLQAASDQNLNLSALEARALEYVLSMLKHGDEYETEEGLVGWIEE